MSELRARAEGRGAVLALATLAVLATCALWALAAHELWRSTVPAGLPLPHVDARRFFSASFLRRSSSYDRFIDVDGLLASLTLLIVLALYARRGHRLMRESAAGRIGTGILLGMLGFALVWLAEVPFGLAAVWWERRHHTSHQGYAASLIDSFLSLGSRFVFVALALAIAMGLAGALRRSWWLVATPLFAALALLSSLLSPYLIPKTHPLRNPAIAADARALAATEGVAGTRVLVQTVSRSVTAPNAEAAGIGPTRRVVLWDTLLDGRFSRREIRVVTAHELGHIAHGHLLRRVGWLVLFLLPATALVALLTRGRGGLGRPEAVPLALFLFVALQLLTLPLWTLVSRHEETEADWSALQATHEPATARALFTRLASTSLSDPDPPAWSYVLYADHPTIAQRIALTEAWQARPPGR
ncbi:MAG TPA: M48 family metalloprotease [Solirubrobacteraceae bacterium]|nr:M48 family metalloprotease [Solirubrobacteraceae bacterium]